MKIIVLVVITIKALVAVVRLAPKVSQPTILKIMKQALNQQALATHKIILGNLAILTGHLVLSRRNLLGALVTKIKSKFNISLGFLY